MTERRVALREGPVAMYESYFATEPYCRPFDEGTSQHFGKSRVRGHTVAPARAADRTATCLHGKAREASRRDHESANIHSMLVYELL